MASKSAQDTVRWSLADLLLALMALRAPLLFNRYSLVRAAMLSLLFNRYSLVRAAMLSLFLAWYSLTLAAIGLLFSS